MYQGSRATRLQRLHVVLDADDRVGEAIEESGGQPAAAGLHHALQLAA